MGYNYEFEYAFPDAMEGALAGIAGLFIGLFLIIYFLALAFSVVSYVLSAVGMYRIAKRRGIHHAWLSWIPVGNAWLLGSISDHYQYVAKQKSTRRRRVLLILSIICTVMGIVFGTGTGVLAASEIMGSPSPASVLSVAMIAIGYMGVLGLSIAITVFCYIAYYDLFRSCKPGNAVLFLVLSILFNVTLPFFVFFISNSDEGMPARRPQQPPQQILEEPVVSEPMEEEIPVVEAEIVEDSEM